VERTGEWQTGRHLRDHALLGGGMGGLSERFRNPEGRGVMSDKYIDLMKPEPYDDGDSILTLYHCTVCGKEAPTPTVSHDERLHRIAELQAENARLKEELAWLETNLNSAEKSGYGADDYWWTILHHDGNKAEGSTLREAIDAARKEAKG
jgi:hypothetical protein